MAPLNLEVLLLGIARNILFARDRHLVVEIEIARILVAFLIGGLSPNAPRTFREDFSRQLQVPVVVDGEIVTTVAQVETTRTLVAIARHDEARTIGVCERKIGKGNS